MTTLVTGASGFLGSHVARLLVERGDRVRVLLRPTCQTRLLEDLAAERVPGDLRDPASLDKALTGVHTVYHVAADYRLWARDPREIYESNVQGTCNLLEAARRAKVGKFVYTSTVGTVAVPRGAVLPEGDPGVDGVTYQVALSKGPPNAARASSAAPDLVWTIRGASGGGRGGRGTAGGAARYVGSGPGTSPAVTV